jgi:hypothetical protein
LEEAGNEFRIILMWKYDLKMHVVRLVSSCEHGNKDFGFDSLCSLWSEFLATDPEVPGSIPGATRFSEK